MKENLNTRYKILGFIIVAVTIICFGAFISACNNNDTATINKVENATITDSEIFMLVDTDDSVSLSDKVECSDNSTWKLYSDPLGQKEIPTKIATGENGALQDGDNIFYIVVTTKGATKVKTYKLIIHKSYLINIYFYNNSDLLKTDYAYSGQEYNITYTPNLYGYRFNGWKDSNGATKTNITPWESISLYIDKTAEYFTTKLDVNGGNNLEEDTYRLLYGNSFTLPVPQKEHYDFMGWYIGTYKFANNDGIIVSDWDIEPPAQLTAKWAIQQHSLTLQNNIGNAGTLTGAGVYDYNSLITIKAIPKNGYSFKGWFDGNNLLSTESIYSITLLNNRILTAKWEYFTVTTTTNNETAGTYTVFTDNKVTCGETVLLEAQTYLGYTWSGWYDINNELVCEDTTFLFKMEKSNVNYIAKWEVAEVMSNFQFSSTCDTCKIIDVINKEVTKIVIPDFVTSIKAGALNGCGLLEELTLPFVGENANSTTVGKTTLFGYIFGRSSFDGAVATTQIYSNVEVVYYIPQSLKIITITKKCNLANAFYNCANIINIILPNGLTSIGNYAFYNCTKLQSIVLPESLTSIGQSAFYRCESLASITIPQKTTHIGMFSFRHCKSLTSIIFEDPNNWVKEGGYSDGPIDVSNSQNLISILVGDDNPTTPYIGFSLEKLLSV